MASALISPALPSIAAYFSNEADVGLWVRLTLTLPALFMVLAAPLAGFLSDHVGRRPTLLASALIYGIGGTAGAFFDHLTPLLVTRALLGLGAGGLMTAASASITDHFEEGEARDRFMGLQSAAMIGGGVVFLLVGGLLANISWRIPFCLYLTALAVIPGTLLAVRDLPRHEAPAVKTHRRAKIGPLLFALAVTFLGMIAYYVIPVQLPFFLSRGGSSPALIGAAIALQNLASGVVATQYHRFKSHFAHAHVAAFGFLTMGFSFFLIALSTGLWQVLAALVICGLGTGMWVPNVAVWIASVTPRRFHGRALGLMVTALFLGQFVSPLVTEPVLDLWGLAATFGGTGIAICGLGALLFLPRR